MILRMSTLTLTYGVCLDGVMPDDSHEFTDPTAAIAAAERLKAENPDLIVSIVLWTV